MLLLGGCVDHVVHADPSFSSEERAAIVDGEAWLSTHASRPSTPIEWDGNDIVRGPAPGMDRAGYMAGGRVYLDPSGGGVTEANFRFVAAHELAHFLYGFEDTYGDPGLMGQWERGEWSASDERQARR